MSKRWLAAARGLLELKRGTTGAPNTANEAGGSEIAVDALGGSSVEKIEEPTSSLGEETEFLAMNGAADRKYLEADESSPASLPRPTAAPIKVDVMRLSSACWWRAGCAKASCARCSSRTSSLVQGCESLHFVSLKKRSGRRVLRVVPLTPEAVGEIRRYWSAEYRTNKPSSDAAMFRTLGERGPYEKGPITPKAIDGIVRRAAAQLAGDREAKSTPTQPPALMRDSATPHRR